MTIQQLQYILEVQRTGSVSKAAKHLYVSQSGISTYILGLEEELGFTIFERTRYGMIPTRRGLQLMEHAAKIVASYRDMMQLSESPPKKIRIGCSGYAPFSNAFVALLAERGDRDDLQFSMENGLGVDKIITMVESGELDLGVLMTYHTAVSYRERQIRRRGLNVVLWAPIPAAIMIWPEHKLFQKTDLLAEDFADERIVDSTRGAIINSSYLQKFIPINREKAILVSNPATRTELLRRGIAYSVSPVFSNMKNKDARLVPLNGASCIPIIITNSSFPTPPEITRYLELLQQNL